MLRRGGRIPWLISVLGRDLMLGGGVSGGDEGWRGQVNDICGHSLGGQGYTKTIPYPSCLSSKVVVRLNSSSHYLISHVCDFEVACPESG